MSHPYDYAKTYPITPEQHQAMFNRLSQINENTTDAYNVLTTEQCTGVLRDVLRVGNVPHPLGEGPWPDSLKPSTDGYVNDAGKWYKVEPTSDPLNAAGTDYTPVSPEKAAELDATARGDYDSIAGTEADPIHRYKQGRETLVTLPDPVAERIKPIGEVTVDDGSVAVEPTAPKAPLAEATKDYSDQMAQGVIEENSVDSGEGLLRNEPETTVAGSGSLGVDIAPVWGNALSSDTSRPQGQIDPVTAAAQSLQSALTFLNTLRGGDALSIAASGVNLYNALDRSLDLPGEWGDIGGGLNLALSLRSGNLGNIAVSGLSFANTLTDGKFSQDIALALGFDSAQNFLPGFSAGLSALEGDLEGAAFNALLAYAPPQISVPLMVVNLISGGGLFGGGDETPEIPTIRGSAEVRWDDQGHLTVSVTQDENGGGEHTSNLLTQLLAPLEQALAGESNDQYGIIPQRLPTVSLFARTRASLYLNYTEADPAHPQYGQTVSRYFDSAGNRPQGDANIAQAFLDQAITGNAFVYKWEADTVRERMNRGDTDAWKKSKETGASNPLQNAA